MNKFTMKILLLYVLLASFLSCCNGSKKTSETGDNIVNAGTYELKFEQLFQQYWRNNRTLTEDLRNALNIPKQINLKVEELPNCHSPKKCLICRAFSFTFLTYYQNHFEQNLDEYLFDLCTILAEEPDYVCIGMINIYGPTIKYILKHRTNELSSERICGILFQYDGCSANKYVIDFTIEPAHGMEPVVKVPKQYQFGEKATNSSSFLTIAHLSDFHFDPYYSAGSSSNCIDFLCCRNTSIPKENSTQEAGYWGDYLSCDSPSHLIENICSQVATNHKNIDLIYYTGDFADHFSWLTTKSSIKHSIEFVTQQIKEKFPKTPVIMVIGNHDIHPSDAFAPESTSEYINSKWLYEIAADLWSDWLPQTALSTFRRGGYYSYSFRSGLRIIVLNNNLCFTHNIWLLYSSEEMVVQLSWLRDTLLEAEKNNEKVHILGHIPPNTSSCIRAWNREYNKLIIQFSHIISGQFNGHTHTDEFTLFYSEDDDNPIPLNVAYNGGSGTSFIGLNSNYRLYLADNNTFEIVDQETFIFNLTEANMTPGQPPRWFREYSFRDAFSVPDMSPYTLSKLVNDTFRHDRSALYKYWSYKYKLASPKMESGCNDACLEELRLITNGDMENTFF
ncbi:sphingomyelin phosphodiesterase-like [Contarinia nasturtii]|uniref:sphingomyelin phosphodiesterase-like n=1 Tax=Contarinia nasturtii TaxID=265458 RepID=UPI0012D42824|nr:sphingomyelin phosphodiesterase-like [Contarinia nasturtii]